MSKISRYYRQNLFKARLRSSLPVGLITSLQRVSSKQLHCTIYKLLEVQTTYQKSVVSVVNIKPYIRLFASLGILDVIPI